MKKIIFLVFHDVSSGFYDLKLDCMYQDLAMKQYFNVKDVSRVKCPQLYLSKV